MKRDLTKLVESTYDLLVIGGGVNGACAAWDAALRGLSVALIDKGDFGAATSANSLKIIHGGFRHLQQLNISRIWESIHEQATLMLIAPHLVQPIPFLIPTYGHFKRGKVAFSLALKMYDSFRLHHTSENVSATKIPSGRLISRDECLEIFPAFEKSGLTGGAVWYDCQVHNSERFTLSFLLSAAELGARLANYVEVTRFITKNDTVCGVHVIDKLTGQEMDLRARMVLNASGPWIYDLIRLAEGKNLPQMQRQGLALAINLVSRRFPGDIAIGIQSKTSYDQDPVSGGNRFLFLVPWREYTLIGTSYKIFNGHVNNCRVTRSDLQQLVDKCNEACPALGLNLQDVCFHHYGLLPLNNRSKTKRSVSLATNFSILDHTSENGISGLVSIIGVKYTAARAVAEKAIDLVFRRLGNTSPPNSKTSYTPIYGGRSFHNKTQADTTNGAFPECLAEEARKRLAKNYGSRAWEVGTHAKTDPAWARPITEASSVLRCEILHAVRAEMAVKLVDVVFRRTDLGTAECPPKSHLKSAARIMANELGWDERQQEKEIEDVRRAYEPLRVAVRQ